jgi:hypothetical protein
VGYREGAVTIWCGMRAPPSCVRRTLLTDVETKHMATAKELRAWAATARRWVAKIDDTRTAQDAAKLAAELDCLAACLEVADRQLA